MQISISSFKSFSRPKEDFSTFLDPATAEKSLRGDGAASTVHALQGLIVGRLTCHKRRVGDPVGSQLSGILRIIKLQVVSPEAERLRIGPCFLYQST